MCNYRANRLACDAADRAMQTCGGVGYSRHMPFEHIYRHHRRYRITEGSEEIQMRKVGQHLFGFGEEPQALATKTSGGELYLHPLAERNQARQFLAGRATQLPFLRPGKNAAGGGRAPGRQDGRIVARAAAVVDQR